MYRKANVLFLMNQTPMHAGSGDSLGIVDMPIQRERHTGFPKIEASSLKGSMREHFERELVLREADQVKAKENLKKINISFGFDEGQVGNFKKKDIKEMFKDKDGKDVSEFAGALGFTDARILLFPVKSLNGIFAYITCPQVLKKLKDELENVCSPKVEIINSSNFDELEGKTSNLANLKTNNERMVMLEEYSMQLDKIENSKIAEELATLTGNQDIKNRLVILSNDIFKDFVTNYTEVITRTKISNETGTVEPGALFTEEYLPAETVMYSLVMASPVFSNKKQDDFKTEDDIMEFAENLPKVIQIGGNSTLGKGITKTKIYKNENK